MSSTLSPSVLIVDDDASIRRLIKFVLERIGLEIAEAEDGCVAVYRCVESTYDLITLDIDMPNLDGHATIEALRTVDPYVPVLVVSGCTDADTRQRVAAAGISQFIPKPLCLGTFERAVRVELSRPRPARPAATPAEVEAQLATLAAARRSRPRCWACECPQHATCTRPQRATATESYLPARPA